MNYYDEIKNKLIKSEIYDRVKDYSKDRHKVSVYFEIGELLSKAGKEYGKNIIKQYSEKLVIEVGKKYNERTLRRIRQFYTIFSEGKWSPLATNLTWSHYVEILSIKDINKIEYYLQISISNNLSRNELRKRIKSNEYERLPVLTKNKLVNKEKLEVSDFVPNPIIIKSDSNEELSEYALKESILNHLDDFLFQLGRGFTYVGNEYRIKLNNYNYIDILLYNIEFNCYAVVELKTTELKKEHVGQIQVYMNYIDNNLKTINQNETIGIVICKQENRYVIKYCSDDRIIARTYELI